MTGEKLKQIRTSLLTGTGKKMTQARFAELLDIPGIDHSQISRIEKSDSVPHRVLTRMRELGLPVPDEAGVEWMVRHGENGQAWIIHLHDPKFTALVLDKPVPGSYSDPETGTTVGEFEWLGNRPEPQTEAELAAAACIAWESLDAMIDRS